MKLEWYIFFDDEIYGPFSLLQLKRDERLSPDLWVWKEGFEDWKRARYVSELAAIFREDRDNDSDEDLLDLENPSLNGKDEIIAMKLPYDPHYFWILIVIILLVFLIWYYV